MMSPFIFVNLLIVIEVFHLPGLWGIHNNNPFVRSYPNSQRRKNKEKIYPIVYGKKEPSCEELRAMWKITHRQARNAQITNNVPYNQDPFFTQRSFYKSSYPGYMEFAAPTYGELKTHSPYFRGDIEPIKMVHHLNNWHKMNYPYFSTTRMMGGPGGIYTPNPDMSSTGQFEKLRKILNAEKAREAGVRIGGGKPGYGTFYDSGDQKVDKLYGTIVNSPEEKAKFKSYVSSMQQVPGSRTSNTNENKPVVSLPNIYENAEPPDATTRGVKSFYPRRNENGKYGRNRMGFNRYYTPGNRVGKRKDPEYQDSSTSEEETNHVSFIRNISPFISMERFYC